MGIATVRQISALQRRKANAGNSTHIAHGVSRAMVALFLAKLLSHIGGVIDHKARASVKVLNHSIYPLPLPIQPVGGTPVVNCQFLVVAFFCFANQFEGSLAELSRFFRELQAHSVHRL